MVEETKPNELDQSYKDGIDKAFIARNVIDYQTEISGVRVVIEALKKEGVVIAPELFDSDLKIALFLNFFYSKHAANKQ